MSSKILAVCLGVAVVGSVGCTGEFVSRHIYDRDMNQYKGYNEALERDNAEMRPKAEAYDQLKREWDLTNGADKTYAELAESLKKALAGMDIKEEHVYVDPRSKAVVFSGELLNFDLGKFEVTPKGKAVIKKLAEAHHASMFRLVGHTDMKPIKNDRTKQLLITDSNPELSVLRAVAVMGEFMKCGIHENQFASIEGHSWLEPSGDAKSSRRVEIFFVGDAPASKPATIKTSAKSSKK